VTLKPADANTALKEPEDIKGPLSYDTIIAMRCELRGIRAKIRSMMSKVGELDDVLEEFEEKFKTMHKDKEVEK
jgi:hypothetical protein